MSTKFYTWIAALVLGLIGLGLNALPLTLFYRVDFIFGSVASLTAIALFGWKQGLVATTIASSYTIFLWGHPYAFIIFVAEGVFVAAILRKRSEDLILATGAYWLIAGMLLVFTFYGFVMGMDTPATVLIMLKQAVNGIVNAFFASLLLFIVPVHRFKLSRPEKTSFKEWLSIPVAGLVLLPCVGLTIVESRSDIDRIEQLAAQRLQLSIRNTSDHVEYLYGRRLTAISELAEYAAGPDGLIDRTALQERMAIMKELFPDFHTFYVADHNGTTIAFDPERNERGELTVGSNFADRDYFQKLTNTLKPVISDVLPSRTGVFVPIQTVSVPILRGDQLLGFASGALDLSAVVDYLQKEVEKTDLHLTLIDQQNQVIASTLPEQKPLTKSEFDPETLGSTRVAKMWLLTPKELIPKMLQINRSSYVVHEKIGEKMPWHLIAQAPVGPYQTALNRAYIDNLAVGLVIVVVIFLVARLIITKLTTPIVQLAQLTQDVPKKLLGGESVHWPSSRILEIDSLTQNLQSMSAALLNTFSEVREHSSLLSRTNTELQSEISSRQRTEQALRQGEEFLRKQNNVFLQLARARGERTHTLEQALQQITVAASRVLGVSRASVWFFDEERTKVYCRNLFEAQHEKHISGQELLASKFPLYFAALNTERAIAAHDARHDSRTAEFAKDYLEPLGIVSMLDAPIWLNGKMVGMVCHEHVGNVRTWTSEEEAFSGAIGDIVALTVEEHNRLLAQKELEQSRSELLHTQQELQKHAEELESRVAERTAKLQEVVAQLEAFSYTVSHDLRAPLRSLIGYADVLREDFAAQLPAEARQYLDRISSGADRLDKLIQDVLTYSRVAQGELTMRRIDLDQLVYDVVAEYPALHGTDISLHIERPLLPVIGSEALLTQCLSNLIGNAVKFSKEGVKPEVWVRSEVRNGRVRVSVQDNGIGIEQAYTQKIFGIFERVENGSRYPGTGIGLAIVRKAVERMGGCVDVKSQPGVGSCFWIDLRSADE